MASSVPRRGTRNLKRPLTTEEEEAPNTSPTYGGRWKRQCARRSGNTTPVGVSAGSSHFTGAHNFIVDNLTMNEGVQQIEQRSNEALKWLANHVIPGAEFDSAERDPPPRCHPQTRISIRNKISAWFRDPERSTNILWMHGPAGVGKSAIVQTLAESENASKTLGAALFFSRLNYRDDLKKALPTIAYQLAVRFPPYQDYIHERMVADPRLLEKGMAEQFRVLIVQPFAVRKIYAGSETLSIFLDGLDECRAEAAQCEIIQLIGHFVQQHPTVSLVWVISSRPEPHLQDIFSSEDVSPEDASSEDVSSEDVIPIDDLLLELSPKKIRIHCLKEYIPVDSKQACQDVERYLRIEFRRIRQHYPRSIPSASEWPSEGQFLVLASAASGLFVFAVTAIRFIDEENIADPISQLDTVLAMLNELNPTAMSKNPLAALDTLYTQILSRIPDSVLGATKRILGHVLLQLQDHRPSFSFIYTSNLLGLRQNVAYSALQRLYSVVQVPSPESAASTGLRVYHASFSDYLRSRSRSQKFWIDLERESNDIWWCYFRILQQVKIEQPSQISNISLSWPLVDEHAITSSLYEDAKFWWTHQIIHESSYLGRSAPPARLQGRSCVCSQCTLVSPGTSYGRYLVFLKTSELRNVLRQLNFRRLFHGYLCSSPDKWMQYVRFLRWLFELSAHPEMVAKGLVKRLSLSDVDIDRVIVDGINYPPRIYRMHGEWWVDIARHDSVDETWNFHGTETLKDRLQLQKLLNPASVCAIWGVDTSKKCLVVECNPMPGDVEYFDSEMFWLPYA